MSSDIRWLLRDKYGWDESRIVEFLRTSASGQPAASGLAEDLDRLGQGEPLPYVIGWVSFLGCRIDLRNKPLIPRPETEYWVEQVLKSAWWKNLTREKSGTDTPRILDLCCGSGCIGIAVLKDSPSLHVDFADINPAFLEQTILNLQLNHLLTDNTRCIESNLFENLPPDTYDVVFSNPPYVDPAGEFSGDLKWEPSQALFAQNNGFALIESIFQDTKKYLRKGGRIVLEFGKGQEQRITELCEEVGFSEWHIEADQYGVPRYCWAVY